MNGFDEEIQDAEALMDGMVALPSDINASPAMAANAAKRMLHTMQPERPLCLMEESKSIMESILEENRARATNGSVSSPVARS